jgi:ribonuclease HII
MESREVRRLINLCRYEDDLYIAGYRAIAGVDEVGRGSLAGPLVAAAVILERKNLKIENIDDSKKITAEVRKYIFKKIIKSCLCWSVARVSPNEIDRLSMSRANMIAFKRAVKGLKKKPDIVLADFIGGDLGDSFLPIVKGDQISVSIAAASIIAKVIRDKIMLKLSKLYPEYGFEHNKGYGTPQHLKALQMFGPTIIHRSSFRGVLN